MAMASCKESQYPGFKQMDNGTFMKYYIKAEESTKPMLGDVVSFEMAQYLGDSLIYSTSGQEPIEFTMSESAFVGDVSAALSLMNVGDSVSIVFPVDSLYSKGLGIEIPAEMKGMLVYYDLKLLTIKPAEEVEAEYREWLNELKNQESDLLKPYVDDPKNSITNSGLIVLSRKGGKGATPKDIDYVNFDFLMTDLQGDTILSTFGRQPIEIPMSNGFLSVGFEEILGMMSKGESMRVILPSSLAFDSTGYQDVIAPYTPILVDLKMNDILNQNAYDKKMEAAEAKRQAELEKIIAEEQALISKYVTENNITTTPTSSGLYITEVQSGSGKKAEWGDKVSIHYALSNLNGQKVESSYDHQTPLDFTIGQGEMILGIEEAVMTMNKGSKTRLIVPFALGFGDVAVDPELLPANSTMIIDLELIDIK
jgi:FKBP-type peptidyl-prolyl cis-trans isomerases 1